MNIYVYVCVCVCVYTHMYTYLCTCVYVNRYIYIYIYVCVCVSVCEYKYVHIYTYIYVLVHVCVYIYIYIFLDEYFRNHLLKYFFLLSFKNDRNSIFYNFLFDYKNIVRNPFRYFPLCLPELYFLLHVFHEGVNDRTASKIHSEQLRG